MSAIKKEVVIGDCRLILGDCLEVMPLLREFDAVVTDPPYGLGAASGTISKQNAHKRDYSSFEDTEEYLKKTSVPAIKLALLKAHGRGIITPGSKHAFEYPKPEVMGCFYQPATTGMCTWGRTTQQPILFYGKDPYAGKTIQHITYVLTERPSTKLHPCAKPMKAWQWIVKRASKPSEHIIDPFMGSGTTGVACVKLGRKFTGIELDPEYFEIACERIRKAYEQPDMFIAKPGNPVTLKQGDLDI